MLLHEWPLGIGDLCWYTVEDISDICWTFLSQSIIGFTVIQGPDEIEPDSDNDPDTVSSRQSKTFQYC